MNFYSYFFLLVLGVSCQVNAQTKLSPADFQAKIKSSPDAQLLDVRTPAEVSQGFIEGAKFLNFQSPEFIKAVEKLDKDKPVLVYCAAGGRSGRAATLLISKGFKQVFDLSGGMNAWASAGMPIKK